MDFNNNLSNNYYNNLPAQIAGEDLLISEDRFTIQNLQKIWSGEKFSKQLLKYEEEFIENLKDKIEKMEKEIQTKINSNNNLKEDCEILELDLERVKFVLKDYLRIRLAKIDKYLIHIVKEDLHSLLSKSEFEYAFELFKSKRTVFNDALYKNIAPELRDFQPYPDKQEMIVSPDSLSYVIVKSVSREPIPVNVRDIWADSSETAIIKNEEIYCLPYILIR